MSGDGETYGMFPPAAVLSLLMTWKWTDTVGAAAAASPVGGGTAFARKCASCASFFSSEMFAPQVLHTRKDRCQCKCAS